MAYAPEYRSSSSNGSSSMTSRFIPSASLASTSKIESAATSLQPVIVKDKNSDQKFLRGRFLGKVKLKLYI